MKRIEASRPTSWHQAFPRPRGDAPAGAGRALIPLTNSAVERGSEPTPQHARASAAFLAQLIAARDNIEQSRAKRRLDPAHAISAYRTAAIAPTVAGNTGRSV
jgi:hypothetical protein